MYKRQKRIGYRSIHSQNTTLGTTEARNFFHQIGATFGVHDLFTVGYQIFFPRNRNSAPCETSEGNSGITSSFYGIGSCLLYTSFAVIISKKVGSIKATFGF